MLILSFALTTAALIAREKRVTRRQWSDYTYDMWAKRIGQDFQCWDRSPRFGGKKVAEARLVSLTRELTSTIPESDWEAEGFAYMERHGIALGAEGDSVVDRWNLWRSELDLETSVIRFDNVRVLDGFTPEMFWPLPPEQRGFQI